MNNSKNVTDATFGLQFEDELFAKDGPQVGIWTATKTSLVCPRAYRSKVGFERAMAMSNRHGWPVRIRKTGGGVVPQGLPVKNLVLAFDAPNAFNFEDGYRLIVSVIKAGLGEKGAILTTGEITGSFCDGNWNLSIDGKKVAGTAQRWRPRPSGLPRVLAHAMILTRNDLEPCVKAVSAFHDAMDLGQINPEVHTSLQAEFDLRELPTASLCEAAHAALAVLHQ